MDTNVLSELMRAEPSPPVEHWLAARPPASLFTTTLTEAEILYGIRVLPAGARRRALERAARGMFDEDFAGRVLPFDRPAAQAFAGILASRRRRGRPMAQLDGQIAAIAASRGAGVATRDVADFEGCGIAVHDPWRA